MYVHYSGGQLSLLPSTGWEMIDTLRAMECRSSVADLDDGIMHGRIIMHALRYH